ncbi:MAG: hypothetical protein WD472_11395 [Dehalococcoidia bacterium]
MSTTFVGDKVAIACGMSSGWYVKDGHFYTGPFSSEAEARAADRPAEDLTPEGVQLVIPGAERIQPENQKQGDLF